MINYLRLAVCVISLTASAVAAAQRQPARVGTGEDSLPARIEFPELKGDASAVVRCAAQVEDGGDMEKNGCYTEGPSDQLFIPAINEGARRAQMTPASVDGREVEVYFQYRVKFEKKDAETSVTVLENPGVTENVEAYGEDHVAAQRAVGDERWQEVCPSRAQYLVWLRAHVAPDGSVSNPSLTHGGGIMPTPRCQQSILETVENSIFFPALSDGEAVPSTYVEPFGN